MGVDIAEHVAMALDHPGRHLDIPSVPTTEAGYARLLRWSESLGDLERPIREKMRPVYFPRAWMECITIPICLGTTQIYGGHAVMLLLHPRDAFTSQRPCESRRRDQLLSRVHLWRRI